MKSLKALAVYVDGNVQELDFENGKQFIHAILGKDLAVLPRYLTLLANDKDGKQVSVTIPYNESGAVRVI